MLGVLNVKQGANLAFLKPDFETLDFLTLLDFFENKKKTDKLWIFFSRKSLTLAKHCLSCIFTANLFWESPSLPPSYVTSGVGR